MEASGEMALKAIEMAMEGEKKARAFYLNAEQRTANLRGKELFRGLADFEEHHYLKLKGLYDSLAHRLGYVAYEPRELAQGRAEAAGGIEPNKMEIIDILEFAIESEEKARSHYEEMAENAADPMGKQMFKRLAAEEDGHWQLLNLQYKNLAEKGVWSWG